LEKGKAPPAAFTMLNDAAEGEDEVKQEMHPHAVLIPYPTAGQLNPMLQLAELLQSRGFYITFVNTEFSRRQLLRTGGPGALSGTETFRFVTIADGVSQADHRSPDRLVELWLSIQRNCPAALAELLLELNASSDVPRITFIVANYLMIFTRAVAEQIGVPELVFWTTSACGLMASLQLGEVVRRGYIPFKDESCLTNGYLDTAIDWIPGMKEMRLRDLSSFIRTTDHDDIFLKTEMEEVDYALKAWGLILNTFEDMESEVLDALQGFFPRIYTLGAIGSLVERVAGGSRSTSPRLGFWREDRRCMDWLDAQQDASVIYVSFGSLAVLTVTQLTEFAWGLADSNHPFLWVIRPDMVEGGAATLPEEFIEETKGRSFFAGWCRQGEVLAHPSIAGFLTHSGWNSMMESVACGVPVICWPGFAEQYTNCLYACEHWGFGMEIDQVVQREQVKDVVVELLEGEKGKEMRKNATKWKEMAARATAQGGSSLGNLERLVKDLNHP
ncbi:hypothetical protein B296_00040245, partial [Ensete ventricosum]